MKSSKTMVYSACVLFVFLSAIAGVWALSNHLPPEHDLTDEQLSGVYGRQPGPDCIGCVEYMTSTPCTGTSPCGPCVQQGVGETVPCPHHWEYENNNTSWKTRFLIPGDETNTDYHEIDTRECRARYVCQEGMVVQEVACGMNGCMGMGAGSCKPCTPTWTLIFPFAKPWESCIDCPFPSDG